MNSSGRWLVLLDGETQALERLSEALDTSYVRVEKIGDQHYLSSEEFQDLTDPGQVEQLAGEFLQAANGALRVKDPSYLPFAEIVAAIRETPGKPLPVVVRPKSITLTTWVGTPTVIGGTPPKYTFAEIIRDRIRLSRTNRDVELVLRYLDSPNLDFGDLYKIGEIIQRQAGGKERSVGDRGWATGPEFKRFKQTANYYRHALGGRDQLPPKPMTLTEGKQFACKVVDTWLTDYFG